MSDQRERSPWSRRDFLTSTAALAGGAYAMRWGLGHAAEPDGGDTGLERGLHHRLDPAETIPPAALGREAPVGVLLHPLPLRAPQAPARRLGRCDRLR